MAAAGAGLIKVTAHTGGPQLPQPTLRALVDAAHAVGLPVVVHAEGAGTVAAAYAAGADLLAHTPWTERLDDALVRDCAARMCWISTSRGIVHSAVTRLPRVRMTLICDDFLSVAKFDSR